MIAIDNVSMKSGLGDRNNVAGTVGATDRGRAVSMKSGLGDRNNLSSKIRPWPRFCLSQ